MSTLRDGPHRQHSFSGGVLAPAFHSRTDTPRYAEALRECRNFLVTPEGNAQRRTGTRYLGPLNPALAPGGEAALFVPFIFSSSQSYVVAFDGAFIRFWRDGKLVTSPQASTPAFAGVAVEGGCYVHSGRVYRAKVATTFDPATAPASWHLLPRNAGEPADVLEIDSPYSGFWQTYQPPVGLKWSQSGDTLVLYYFQKPAYELKRYSSTRWTLNPYSTLPSAWGATVPAALVLTASTAADATHPAKNWEIVVTAFSSGDFPEESKPSAILSPGGGLGVYVDRPATYGWTALAGSASYGVYRGQGGVWGFIGTTNTNSFRDDGREPDYSTPPPTGRNPFDSTGLDPDRNPRVGAFYDQREWFADTGYLPATFWATRLAQLHSFDKGIPAKVDDYIQATISSTKFEEIRSMLAALESLLLFSAGGVWGLSGPQGVPPNPADGVVATLLHPVPASFVDPIAVGDQVLYITDLVYHLREITFSGATVRNPVQGRDLSLIALHLFKGYRIKAAWFSRTPLETIWLLRDDGRILACSYSPESQQVAWSWHDIRAEDFYTGGSGHVITGCVIPENGEDVLYLCCRGVGGVNSVHRLIVDAPPEAYDDTAGVAEGGSTFDKGCFADWAVVYQGRWRGGDGGLSWSFLGPASGVNVFVKLTGANPGAVNIELSGAGAAWNARNVGDILRYAPGGVPGGQTITITGYVDPTHVTGVLSAAVPGGDFGVITRSFELAVAHVYAPHLPATGLCAMIDGVAYSGIAGPAGDGYVALPVHGYEIVLGIPYTSQLELLDLAGGRTEHKNVPTVFFEVRDTGSLKAGENFASLLPWTASDEVKPDPTTGLVTDLVRIGIESSWNLHGRACVQQTDPLPAIICAAIREVRGGG